MGIEDDGQSFIIKCTLNPNTPSQKRKAREGEGEGEGGGGGGGGGAGGAGGEGEGEGEGEEVFSHDYPPLIGQGSPVDIMSLLFPPYRKFLIRNDGTEVMDAELQGKTIVLLVVALHEECLDSEVTVDIIDAYNDLSDKDDVAFVFVGVQIVYPSNYYTCYGLPCPEPVSRDAEKVYFDNFLASIPFPTIPFDDTTARDKVVKIFGLDSRPHYEFSHMPYWSIINPENTIVATSSCQNSLFSCYVGAELYAFTKTTINKLYYENYSPWDALKNLEQLLVSPPRDFLLLGDKEVHISSLDFDETVIGLYFCAHDLDTSLKELLKKVCEDAKTENCAFQIVQTRFHVRGKFDALSVQQSYDNVDWLRVPFKDPSQRKLLRIFRKVYDKDSYHFDKEFLVIVDKRKGRFNFEFSGVGILERYWVAGYPFTRQSLSQKEYDLQKESAKLKLLFPDLVLTGKKVLLLFAWHRRCNRTDSNVIRLLMDMYNKDVFEVLYVSYDGDKDSFDKCTADMPWIVHPFSQDIVCVLRNELFKAYWGDQIAAFNESGELIAKGSVSSVNRKGRDNLKFPFVSTDLKLIISGDVETMGGLNEFYDSSSYK